MNNRPLLEQARADFLAKIAKEAQANVLFVFSNHEACRLVFMNMRHYALDHGWDILYTQRAFRRGSCTVRFGVVDARNVDDYTGIHFSHVVSTGTVPESVKGRLRAWIRRPSVEKYTLPMGWYFLRAERRLSEEDAERPTVLTGAFEGE